MYSPTLLSWAENLSTGDHELDTQHKYLIEICNDLATAIEKKHDPKITEMVLEVLLFYAKSHFKKEEDCMEKYRCKAHHQNQKAHTAFLDRVKAYQAEYLITDDHASLAVSIHQYLTGWILTHILHVDSQLRAAIQNNPAPQTGLQTPQP